MGIPTAQAEIELRHLLLSTAWTQPTAIWLGLHSVAPATDVDYGTELTGNGYLRVLSTTWEFSARSATNSTTITFPTASGNWSSCVSFGLYNSSASTSFLRGGALDTFRLALSGDTLQFSTGTITIQYNTSTDL